jgi:hypothetical protein
LIRAAKHIFAIAGDGCRQSKSIAARFGLVLLALLIPAALSAREFRVGEVEGLFGLTLSHGLLVRVQDRDRDLIGIANGGKAPTVDWDDGNLNYDRGIVSNMVRGSGELTLRWRNFGAYVRGYGLYDFESGLNDRERTELSGNARKIVDWDADVLDYYLTARFDAGGVPVRFRVGNQVLNWGESRMLRFGVDVINPVDLVAVLQPASTTRDIFLPQGMIWGAANLTGAIAVEAFYQYDWRSVRVPPVGWYFSNNDSLGSDGLSFGVAGGGIYSDLGTDLDATFGLPAGTLGSDPDFMKVPGTTVREPKEGGQFGFTVQALVPEWNATKLALHFLNYHSRLALVSSVTANQEAIDATSQDAVDARAAALAPIYESVGLSPEEAAEKAAETAGTLTVGRYANEASFIVEYPEDIQMLGFSFNTATIRTGTLFSGEVSHHFDVPLQIFAGDVIGAAFSPIQFDPSFADNPLGARGADEMVRGFIERGKTQVELGVSQLLGPRLGATRTMIAADVGWVHIHDMPDDKDLRLHAPGLRPTDDGHFPTADSVGYRLIGALTYSSVFGAMNVEPRVVWTHDVSGVTPGPFGNFLEDRMSCTAGLGLNVTNTWTADLSYSTFFGAGRFDTSNDRDFVRLNLSYYY